ncbi:type VII secretion protein EssA [Staphylococcus chromogenes]|uniref:type VII secretion protein EssA n=1 Tax=Staphylococcus chromogenes TaxID=46126 RepID=UPI000D1A884A|nr:type VII secretion protein EssA [Staphylococcus chromogenes]MCE5044136.1 type VII secretion protein EssA [Staphylococcus chromogenes]PTG00355.1 type VII secretion protein EssA [Staphylococcus chromogenes]PTG19655.1 type VII secretion protein EssA [Staphylococcus chromogenes]PTG45336.1 type VII secretion protein EssA [Staphylococcus chromogenes]RIM11257.1 type VII secretion protein EssA [Staphylococcus chromogenes]
MILESVLVFSLLGTTNNGGLEIQVDQEATENVNKDLNEYDTPLFNQESKDLNKAIQQQKEMHQQQIKETMFNNEQRPTSQVADTKRTLFEQQEDMSTTKAPYIQQDQEKNILPYFLMSVGALFTIGFAILTISKWRKREKQDAT